MIYVLKIILSSVSSILIANGMFIGLFSLSSTLLNYFFSNSSMQYGGVFILFICFAVFFTVASMSTIAILLIISEEYKSRWTVYCGIALSILLFFLFQERIYLFTSNDGLLNIAIGLLYFLCGIILSKKILSNEFLS